MKRLCLLLALIMLFTCTGCSYAPGYTGPLQLESLFDRVEPIEGQLYVPAETTEFTAPNASGESSVVEPIPDPGIDLAAMPHRDDDDFVNVLDYIPDLVVDLKYATVNNFTGQVIYRSSEVYLRYGTVLKLMKVQAELRKQGMLLKLWDGFRSVNAHQRLWDAYPDAEYVADPSTGGSDHSRGNTVDVTIVNAYGQELTMPTGFDDFTVLADRDYSDCSDAAAANATLLQELMEANGFEGYENEWWHFSDATEYPVEKVLDPDVMGTYYAKCNEFITLRATPSTSAASLTKILVNQQFKLLGYADEYFSWVEFEGQRGYVLTSYTAKVQ